MGDAANGRMAGGLCGRHIDNLRAALDWAFSPEGDASIGVALTAAAVPLWMQLSLLEECRRRVERALAASREPEPRPGCAPRDETSRRPGCIADYMPEALFPISAAAWTKTLDLAESLEDVDYQLRSLLGLSFFHVASGVDYRAALSTGAQVLLAWRRRGPEGTIELIGERLIGVAQHYLGDQAQRAAPSRTHARSASCSCCPEVALHSPCSWTSGSWRASFLSRILWLQGFSDQAMRDSRNQHRGCARDRSRNLIVLRPVPGGMSNRAVGSAIWSSVEHYADGAARPCEAGMRWRSGSWYGWGYQGVLAIRRGNIANGLRLLRDRL